MSYLTRALAGIKEANRVGRNKLPYGDAETIDPAVRAKYQEHIEEARWIAQEAKKLGITANQFIAGEYDK